MTLGFLPVISRQFVFCDNFNGQLDRCPNAFRAEMFAAQQFLRDRFQSVTSAWAGWAGFSTGYLSDLDILQDYSDLRAGNYHRNAGPDGWRAAFYSALSVTFVRSHDLVNLILRIHQRCFYGRFPGQETMNISPQNGHDITEFRYGWPRP